jgi:hypothetical protein
MFVIETSRSKAAKKMTFVMGALLFVAPAAAATAGRRARPSPVNGNAVGDFYPAWLRQAVSAYSAWLSHFRFSKSAPRNFDRSRAIDCGDDLPGGGEGWAREAERNRKPWI